MSDFYKDLMAEYARQVTPLREQQKKLEEEQAAITLSQGDLARQRATIAVLGRKAEEALALGESTDQPRGELKDLEEATAQRDERIRAIHEELEVTNREVVRAAKTTLDKIYPTIQERIRDEMGKAIDLVDTAWQDLLRFEKESPVELKDKYRDGLRFPPIFETEALRKKLERWL